MGIRLKTASEIIEDHTVLKAYKFTIENNIAKVGSLISADVLMRYGYKLHKVETIKTSDYYSYQTHYYLTRD